MAGHESSVFLNRDFSHVDNFTGYMQVVHDEVLAHVPSGARLLDMPAGNGLLGARLRASGYEVVQGDINDERPDYVRTDMEQPLPFADGEFDAVLCLEGVEHVLLQSRLIAELVRITRPGGLIVVSLPNISNLYSRLAFLFSGTFYQFDPRVFRLAAPGEMIDKGHIAPISVYHLAYQFAARGARLERTHGDRYKKKVLLPLALVLWPVVAWTQRRIERQWPAAMKSKQAAASGVTFNKHLYLSRSLVASFRRD